MLANLVTLACFVATSMAAWHGPLAGGKPADLYPAGISPHECPNYPHCDNPAVALNAIVPQHGAYAGGWNGGHKANYAGGQSGKWNAGYAINYAGDQSGKWNGGYATTYAGGESGKWNGGHAENQNDGKWNDNSGSWKDPKNALDKGEYIGDGDYHGEGLAESGAFGPVHYDNKYNYAGEQNYASAYSHNGPAAKIPKGVDPNKCPNYPYCPLVR